MEDKRGDTCRRLSRTSAVLLEALQQSRGIDSVRENLAFSDDDGDSVSDESGVGNAVSVHDLATGNAVPGVSTLQLVTSMKLEQQTYGEFSSCILDEARGVCGRSYLPAPVTGENHSSSASAECVSSCSNSNQNDASFCSSSLPSSCSDLTDLDVRVRAIRCRFKDQKLLEDALLDCYGRFIALLPESLLRDPVHLYFHIQEAYWWFVDLWVERFTEDLHRLSLREFGLLICTDCPVLQAYVPKEQHDDFLDRWKQYCRTIPLRGAILLNSTLDKCLMVTGWNGETWLFPRGKVDEAEEDGVCACREVWEELGIDITPYLDEKVFIQGIIEDQHIKLFIVPGVREDIQVMPRKRKEIGKINWIRFDELPGVKAVVGNQGAHYHQQRKRFWQVEPFIPCLMMWVDVFRDGMKLQRNPTSYVTPWNNANTMQKGLSNKKQDESIKGGKAEQTPDQRRANALMRVLACPSAISDSSAKSNVNLSHENLQSHTYSEVWGAVSPILQVVFQVPDLPPERLLSLQSFSGHRGPASAAEVARKQQQQERRYSSSAYTPFCESRRHTPAMRGLSLGVSGVRSYDDQDIEKRKRMQQKFASLNSSNFDWGCGYSGGMKPRLGKGALGHGVLNRSQRRLLDAETFGGTEGWSANEMFKLNETKFGVVSTYNVECYTTPAVPRDFSSNTLATRAAKMKGINSINFRAQQLTQTQIKPKAQQQTQAQYNSQIKTNFKVQQMTHTPVTTTSQHLTQACIIYPQEQPQIFPQLSSKAQSLVQSLSNPIEKEQIHSQLNHKAQKQTQPQLNPKMHQHAQPLDNKAQQQAQIQMKRKFEAQKQKEVSLKGTGTAKGQSEASTEYYLEHPCEANTRCSQKPCSGSDAEMYPLNNSSITILNMIKSGRVNTAEMSLSKRVEIDSGGFNSGAGGTLVQTRASSAEGAQAKGLLRKGTERNIIGSKRDSSYIGRNISFEFTEFVSKFQLKQTNQNLDDFACTSPSCDSATVRCASERECCAQEGELDCRLGNVWPQSSPLNECNFEDSFSPTKLPAQAEFLSSESNGSSDDKKQHEKGFLLEALKQDKCLLQLNKGKNIPSERLVGHQDHDKSRLKSIPDGPVLHGGEICSSMAALFAMVHEAGGRVTRNSSSRMFGDVSRGSDATDCDMDVKKVVRNNNGDYESS